MTSKPRFELSAKVEVKILNSKTLSGDMFFYFLCTERLNMLSSVKISQIDPL